MRNESFSSFYAKLAYSKLMFQISKLVRKMNNNNVGVSKERKPRSTVSEHDKKMFINIIRTGEGGKFWSQIVENKGKSTNASRHDLWQNISKIFSEATGRLFDSKQVKEMWHRIKKNAKSKHDQKYKAACAKTGGGIGPDQPEDKDGDEVEFDLDDLDPTNTEFNSLVRPEDRQPITFGQSSSTHPHDAVMGSSASSSPRPGPSTTFGPLFRFPGNPSPVRFMNPSRFPSPELSPSSVLSGQSPSIQEPSPTFSQAQARDLTGITPLSTESGGAGIPRELQVEIVRQDASVEFVEAVRETPKSSNKRSRKVTAKAGDMNEAANNYYVEMLEIQRKLAQKQVEVLEKRVSLLRRREENEKLKSKLLKKQLGEVDNMASSDNSDEESEDDMETLDQAELVF